ncbi:UNVERIFIED_CONTAM: hypothetical protein Sradi_4390800 [Sesamum radiatum]|uniref:GDT1 family protein n=1 Tax=Sesamum radiatum TaxID=300843 RepID=A0AAW2NRM4_SESRA
MVPRRFEDSSIGGAFKVAVILGASVAGSDDLGVAFAAVLEREVRDVLGTTYKAWIVATGISLAFCLFGALVGASLTLSRL